jgi:hypothetical protein
MTEISFPLGYYQFHTVKIINFQLNRWHSLGYARFEDLLGAAQRIRNRMTGVFPNKRGEMLCRRDS